MNLDDFMYELENSNALEHHGVKGMKWGIRKDRHGKTSPLQWARSNRKNSNWIKENATGFKKSKRYWKRYNRIYKKVRDYGEKPVLNEKDEDLRRIRSLVKKYNTEAAMIDVAPNGKRYNKAIKLERKYSGQLLTKTKDYREKTGIALDSSGKIMYAINKSTGKCEYLERSAYATSILWKKTPDEYVAWHEGLYDKPLKR